MAVFILILTLLFILLLTFRFSKKESCEKVEKKKKDLIIWRFALYSGIYSGLFLTYFTVVYATPFRFFFHIILLIAIFTTLNISLPSWICKKRKLIKNCVCDEYRYADFPPAIGLGLLGPITFLILPDGDNLLANLVLFTFFATIAALYLMKPYKNIKALDYPDELKIYTITQLQEFLVSDSANKKLISIVQSSCDFCKLQLEEMSAILEQHPELVRIIDLTFPEKIEAFVFGFLNLEEPDNIKTPTNLIVNQGMNFDRRDGIITHDEINYYLFM